MKVDNKIENKIVHENETKQNFYVDQYSPQNFNRQPTDISVIYNQVFKDKTGFLANLSVLDLLFNEGQQSKHILFNIIAKLPSNSGV
jgi:hypothetical protein